MLKENLICIYALYLSISIIWKIFFVSTLEMARQFSLELSNVVYIPIDTKEGFEIIYINKTTKQRALTGKTSLNYNQ